MGGGGWRAVEVRSVRKWARKKKKKVWPLFSHTQTASNVWPALLAVKLFEKNSIQSARLASELWLKDDHEGAPEDPAAE